MEATGAARRIRRRSYLFFLAFVTVIIFLTHAPLMKLPFYWDELGQFVPASLDLFQTGAWIPYTTVPNIHPPGVMAYLAVFWKVTGYSVPATRVAMLLLASLGAFWAFLLAISLGKGASGFPAFTALMFLCFSPLFVAQAMMAQLDMPVMVFTTLALLLFLQGQLRRAALACVVLAMMKETGIIAPMTFGFCLLLERRWKESLLFTAPLLPLAVWLIALHHGTGHWAGNESFAAYNAVYSLNPMRFALAIVRRFYYLFIGSGHWVGTIALVYAWKHTRIFMTREWKIIGIFAVAHVLMVSLFGGAVLERYLLPVLPILYIAFAVSFSALPGLWRFSAFALLPMLIAANFINPLYPFPFENNLAFTSFVILNQRAAEFVENNYGARPVSTTFPMAGALRRPDFGYVARPMNVHEIDDFRLSTIRKLAGDPPDALILYSIAWDPIHLLERKEVSEVLKRYYDYQPDATSGEIQAALRMHSIARWTQGGQWIEVLEADDLRRSEKTR